LLAATGRTPLTEPLHLHNVAVAVDAAGTIMVDEYQNTSLEGVYALGDVCGQVELTPMAIAAGRRLADR
jgi:glutathione reductase (NADPH)